MVVIGSALSALPWWRSMVAQTQAAGREALVGAGVGDGAFRLTPLNLLPILGRREQ
jgi:hypothetical protein